MVLTLRFPRTAEPAARAVARPPLGEAELEAFHARTSGPLWAYLRRIGGDAAMADDALQESYLRFLCHPPDPDSDERMRRAYLFQIATNLIRDRWRGQERERLGLAQLLLTQPPWVRPRETALKLDFGEAFQRLPPRERALLWLAYVEGYEHREIATILGLKEKSIRVLLFRARKRMAEALERPVLEGKQ